MSALGGILDNLSSRLDNNNFLQLKNTREIMSNYNFEVSSIPTLNIKTSYEVCIRHHLEPTIKVEVLGDDSDKVKVSQSGNQVNIFSEDFSSSGRGSIISAGSTYIQSISGGVVIGGGSGGINISGVSGKVIINGQEIDLSKSADGKTIEPVRINIQAPLCDLDLEFKGHCLFNAQKAHCEETSALIQGGGKIFLNTKSLDLSISGSCDARVTGIEGSLSVSLSGSADVDASGHFSEVSVQISGSGDVKTYGDCSGNYKAQVSGSGDVRHLGQVKGKSRKSIVGSGSIKGLD